MPLEIERKFLVTGDAWRKGAKGVRYRQGYIAANAQHSVRVRIAGDQAFLTIKSGTAKNTPLTRLEFEYAIPPAHAEQMLKELCAPEQIHKTRYRIPYDEHIWEIDVFEEDNSGLVVAEIELTDEKQEINLPPWVGKEVSDDPRYTNAALAKTPYNKWL